MLRSLLRRFLLGEQVFSPADELIFMDGEGESRPIYAENAVILVNITKEKGIFFVCENNMKQTHAKNAGLAFEIQWEDFFKF